MNNLVARYYAENAEIVIYNSRSKLVEFSVDERSAWGLPALHEWKQTSFGCEIEFHFVVAG